MTQYILAFAQRCLYYHKESLKPTTEIAVEIVSGLGLAMHRYPKWMPLRVHVCLEKVLDMGWRLIPKKRFYFNMLAVPYHIAHGLICDYAMRDIIKFIKGMNDKQFYANAYQTDRGIAP